MKLLIRLSILALAAVGAQHAVRATPAARSRVRPAPATSVSDTLDPGLPRGRLERPQRLHPRRARGRRRDQGGGPGVEGCGRRGHRRRLPTRPHLRPRPATPERSAPPSRTSPSVRWRPATSASTRAPAPDRAGAVSGASRRGYVRRMTRAPAIAPRPANPAPTRLVRRRRTCRGKSRLFYPPPNETASDRTLRERYASVVCASCDAMQQCRAVGPGAARVRLLGRRVGGGPHRGRLRPAQPRRAARLARRRVSPSDRVIRTVVP